MIEARELRIGNLILCDDKPATVETLYTRNWDDIYINPYTHDGIEWNDSEFTGILLTEEWLIKFGFEKDTNMPNRWYISKSDTPITIKITRNPIGMLYLNYDTDPRPVYPIFVHKLQNLYYALTGEELILTA